MPRRRTTVCATPGCPNLTPCAAHPPPAPWTGSTSTGFPPSVRARILLRHPQCMCRGCPRCDVRLVDIKVHQLDEPIRTVQTCRRPSTEADHIVARADGGTDHESNGRGMCSPCHGEHTKDQAAAGRRRAAARRAP